MLGEEEEESEYHEGGEDDDFFESDEEVEDAGRVFVVTGGNRGIGLEIVRRLAMLKKPEDVIYLCSRSVYRLGSQALGFSKVVLFFARPSVAPYRYFPIAGVKTPSKSLKRKDCAPVICNWTSRMWKASIGNDSMIPLLRLEIREDIF